jgi:GAF domain-containing protein
MSRALGLTSVLTAPLCAHGELLGVISIGRSGLTNRTQHDYITADRDLFTAVARMVADAISNTAPARPQPSARFQLGRPSASAHRPRARII